MNLEKALQQYLQEVSAEPFDMKQVPLATVVTSTSMTPSGIVSAGVAPELITS